MIWVRYGIPDVPQVVAERVSLMVVLRNPELLRLNYGVFCLHAMQMAMFLVIPQALVDTLGLPIAEHWKIYLGVMFVSFILMIPLIIVSEKKGKTKPVFIGMIMLLLAAQWGFAQYLGNGLGLVLLLFLFFVAFNTMEASLPSLVSRLAPREAKGTALGVYNTLQSLGLFCGGLLGGVLKSNWGVSSIFILGLVFSAVWLIIAFGMQNLSSRNMT
jgi:predicted MFS family arabinose efflux permease